MPFDDAAYCMSASAYNAFYDFYACPATTPQVVKTKRLHNGQVKKRLEELGCVCGDAFLVIIRHASAATSDIYSVEVLNVTIWRAGDIYARGRCEVGELLINKEDGTIIARPFNSREAPSSYKTLKIYGIEKR